MNNASLSMSYLIWRKKWTQEGGISSEKNLTTYTRIAGLILLLGSILLAYHFRDIVDLLVGAFSLLLLFLPAICGMLTKKMYSEAGAFWSSLIGSILFIPTFFVTPKNAFVPCVILSFIIYYSITIYQNKREKDK